MHWTLGNITVTRVAEFAVVAVSPSALLDAPDDIAIGLDWLKPNYVTEVGELLMSIQAFVIEAAGKRILVDPCVGNGKDRPGTPFHNMAGNFLERLANAGFAPETIDIVICTHLHFDHCGWNTIFVDGHWVPTFGAARYIFAAAEYAHASVQEDPESAMVFLDSVEPVFAAGLAELIEGDHQVVVGVSLERASGHTPGHYWVAIRSGGKHAIITGDAIHHPLQIGEPDICSHFCWDRPAARKTRRRLLEQASRNDILVLGSHFPAPVGVRVIVRGGCHRVAEWHG